MEVPLLSPYEYGSPGAQAMTWLPGATRSGLHTQSKVGPLPETAFLPFSISLEPTVMIFRLLPGAVTVPAPGPDFLLQLPPQIPDPRVFPLLQEDLSVPYDPGMLFPLKY